MANPQSQVSASDTSSKLTGRELAFDATRLRYAKVILNEGGREHLIIDDEHSIEGYVIHLTALTKEILREYIPPLTTRQCRKLADSLYRLRKFGRLNSYYEQWWEYINFLPSIKALIEFIEENSNELQLLSTGHQSSFETQRLINRLSDLVRKTRDLTEREDHNFRRSAKKNLRGAIELVESVFDVHARILLVRVDLSIKPRQVDDARSRLQQIQADLSEAKCCLTRLNRALRHRYGRALAGYVWKLELGIKKGWHFHCYYMFNASEHRNDFWMAKELGELWCSLVADGRGRYHSCSGSDHHYYAPALGVLNQRERNAGGILNILKYFTKRDYLFTFYADSEYRFFGRSEKIKKIKSGRPRSTQKSIS